MSAETTITPATSTSLPQRRQQTEWFSRHGNTPPTGWQIAVEQDPERARAFGNAIQDASRRTDDDSLATAAAIAEDKAKRANQRAGKQYERGLNEAKGLLERAAAIKADDTVGEFAGFLAHQIDAEVARAESTVVPDPAPALPEVLGD